MAKISELSAAAALDGTETLAIVQRRGAKQVLLSTFLTGIVPMLQDWYKGDRGDPGGNAMAIGLFDDARTLTIPIGTDLVQTSGHGARGVGHARYTYDPGVDAAYVARLPGCSFVSANGRGFRLAERSVSVAQFGVVSHPDLDQTAVMQRAVSSTIALDIQQLTFDGMTIRSGGLDLTGAQDLLLDGRGAKMLPLGQNGLTFTANGFGVLDIINFDFQQTEGYHYQPVISLFDGTYARIDSNRFSGVGAGVRFQGVAQVIADKNVFRQVGIYPRPAPLDPSGAGFNAAYEAYGFGLRAILCNHVIFDDGNDFANDVPAGGHTADVTGGAGAFTTYLCDNVTMRGKAVNAPGQGFLATGSLQERDVVGDLLAGKLPSYQGYRVAFESVRAEGCNQEGWTLFGVGNADVLAPQSRNNRLASGEVWLCVDVSVVGGSSEEASAASHPIQIAKAGAIGGAGALHIVGSWKVGVTRHRIPGSRYNGVRVDGSYYVTIDQCTIDNYGSENAEGYRSSGISVGYFAGNNRNSSAVTVTNSFFQPAPSNISGGDIFAQAHDQIVNHSGNFSVPNRTVTFVNALGAFKGGPAAFVSGAIGYAQGGLVNKPLMRLLTGQVLGVAQAATAILDMPRLTAAGGSDCVDVIVNGNDDGDGGRTFADKVLVIVGSKAEAYKSMDTGGAAARVYTLSGSQLLLTMASGTYSVTVTGTQLRNGNRNG